MSSSKKKIVLKSSDGETFVVDKAVAVQFKIIEDVIEKDGAETMIPLPNVKGSILDKVIEFCKKHAAETEDSLEAWDAEFVKLDHDTLFDLILAANYLNIKSLLDLTCQTVADMIKGKTPEEIAKMFNINNHFTTEEEEQILRENQWSFDPLRFLLLLYSLPLGSVAPSTVVELSRCRRCCLCRLVAAS